MAIYMCAGCDRFRSDDDHGYRVITNQTEICEECVDDPTKYHQCELEHIWPIDDGHICPVCGEVREEE